VDAVGGPGHGEYLPQPDLARIAPGQQRFFRSADQEPGRLQCVGDACERDSGDGELGGE
jgi:hypothetical protein